MRSATLGWRFPAANDAWSPPTRAWPAATMAPGLQSLLNEIAAETAAAMRGRRPGLARLWAGIEAHLDAGLRRPAARFLADSLHGDEAARLLQRRWRDGRILLLQIELQALGATLAGANARLLGAMIEETAAAEQQLCRSLPAYRRCLQRQLWASRA